MAKGKRGAVTGGMSSMAVEGHCHPSSGWYLFKGLVLTLFGVLLLFGMMTLTKAFAWVFLIVGLCMLTRCVKSCS